MGDMGNVIGAILLGVVAIACFVVSYFQFHEKGFLFNNATFMLQNRNGKDVDDEPFDLQMICKV